MQDLHLLPKVRDSWSYLYVEHCKIDQDAKAIAVHDARGRFPVPCASLTLLMLGPGTSISHAAVRALADNGCIIVWTGEEAVRFYAQGQGETRSSRNTLWQAWLWSDQARRLEVVTGMYRMRFDDDLDPSLTLRQIRGKEGIRVREAYAKASRESGVPWSGRTFARGQWGQTDPINRALSAANSTLYGICHAAIVSAGYSTALGFIHTGKMLSFVYDIADLYKVDLTIPRAFDQTAVGTSNLETRVRHACRDAFHRGRLLPRIVQDIDRVLGLKDGPEGTAIDFDADFAAPGGLWDPEAGVVEGGVNYSDASGELDQEDVN